MVIVPQFPPRRGVFRTYSVPHYYGDHVRALFIIAAALSAIIIPILGDILPLGIPTQVVGIVLLVILAGLTSPQSTLVLWFDALFSAAIVVFVEVTAISMYSPDTMVMFVAREAVVLLLLFAMYFSIKTVRAMQQHIIGHNVEAGELDDTPTQ